MDENLQFWLDGIRQMISVEELWAKHAPTKTDVETHQMTADRLKTLKTFLEENTK